MLNAVTVIYGPPGTGKTTELIRRLTGKREMLLAFTRAAAKELKERLTGDRKISTIHSICFQLIGANKTQIFDHHREFSDDTGILCEGKQTFGAESVSSGDRCLEAIHKARSRMVPLNSIECDEPYSYLAYVEEQYRRWKESHGLLDFDDLLTQFCETWQGNLDVDHLIVDEGQDLSSLQWRVIRKISKGCDKLTLAGDPDQCIFDWAGADSEGLRKWGGGVEILGQSWRIPARIHELANKIIRRVPDRVEKVYRPRPVEGFIGETSEIQNLPIPTEDTLILFRNHSQRRDVFDWLVHDHPTPFLGKGSPFQSKWAMGIRMLTKLRNGEDVPAKTVKMLFPKFEPGMLKYDPFDMFPDMPPEVSCYLKAVDIFADPVIRVSTIHAAKGAEAENVILLTGMGERTMEEATDAEHRVWYVGVTRAKHSLWLIDGPNPYLMP